MLRGAIFDIDGTLVDSVDAHASAWSEAFEAYGYKVKHAQARAQIGKGGDKLLPVFLDEEARARDGEALEKAHNTIFRERYRASLKPFPKVRALFQALRAHDLQLALASSSEGPDLDFYKDLAEISDLVHTATSSEDVENSKPAPDIFAVALDRLRPLPADRTLAFGDSPWDAESAGGVSLRTIGLRCGGFDEQALRDAGAIRLYADPADLLRHVDEILSL